MSPTRREFLERSSLAALALAFEPGGRPGLVSPSSTVPPASIKELCMVALDAAWGAGASYADARVTSWRRQTIVARNDRVTDASDTDSFGMGVRVLLNGAWGFAATPILTRDECTRIARAAAQQARANAVARLSPVTLAPVDSYPNGSWRSPIVEDPFEVPLDEKVAALLQANAAALGVKGAWLSTAAHTFVRNETTFASTTGSVIVQTIFRTFPTISVTAVAADASERQTRTSFEVSPAAAGYEHVRRADLAGHAAEWAHDAVAKLGARAVEPGVYDLILDPSNLALTIHQTIGRAISLTRALGYEAHDRGTTFLAPPRAVLAKYRLGPEFLNVQADRTQVGGLATTGWDAEGVPADSWPVVQDGVFVDYQTTRDSAGTIAAITGNERSHGCAVAKSWDTVPIAGMPNISLLAGADNHSRDDLIAATDRGIVISGGGRAVIDPRSYDFQYGGQVFHEVRGGKIVGLLKDVAYVGRAPSFWHTVDMVGGPAEYRLVGTAGVGEGDPLPTEAASHGCPVARFHAVTVIRAAPVA